MTYKEILIKFIQENLVGKKQSIKVTENDQLIDLGLVDSIGLMKIISFIEEETGIRISDEEVIPDNFETVQSIDQLINRLNP